jgi:hypothetical protein
MKYVQINCKRVHSVVVMSELRRSFSFNGIRQSLQTFSSGAELFRIASDSPPAASLRLDFRHRRSHGIGQHLTVSPSLSLQTPPISDFV